jgi:hypothetical protein
MDCQKKEEDGINEWEHSTDFHQCESSRSSTGRGGCAAGQRHSVSVERVPVLPDSTARSPASAHFVHCGGFGEKSLPFISPRKTQHFVDQIHHHLTAQIPL